MAVEDHVHVVVEEGATFRIDIHLQFPELFTVKARDGFPLYDRMHLGLKYKQKLIQRWAAGAGIFLVDGELPEIGHVIRQPALAETLQRLADQGRDGFYAGQLAADMVEEVRAAGGIWALEDLARYSVKERAPIEFSYQGVKIISAPPPSSGGRRSGR